MNNIKEKYNFTENRQSEILPLFIEAYNTRGVFLILQYFIKISFQNILGCFEGSYSKIEFLK